MVGALDTNVAVDFLRGVKKITDKVLSFNSIYLPDKHFKNINKNFLELV